MDTDEMQDVQPEEMDETTEQTEETQDEQEKDWKSEALKYKAMAYKYRIKAQEGEKSQPKKPISKEEPAPESDDDRLWEVAELIQKGYTREDAKFIQSNGGKEALKDPNSYVSAALRTIQEQRRAESEASKATAGTGQSEIERKYTEEQLKNMSAEELAKILPHADPY
jgi:hypothetical protein